MVTLAERFAVYGIDLKSKFEDIKHPRHPLRDVCAFLMLHDLAPSLAPYKAIARASHDVITLYADTELLNAKATDEDIRVLHLCGVFVDEDEDCLQMFV